MEPRKPSKPYSNPYEEKKLRRHLPPTAEWGSPQWLVDAAVETMGRITTDPCTSPIFQDYIKASYSYTQAENGLAQPWYGSVFINPPIIHSRAYWARMVDDWEAGIIEQAMFVSSYPDHTYQLHYRYADNPYKAVAGRDESRDTPKLRNRIAPFTDEVMMCLFDGRVKFMQYRPDWETPGIENSKGARHGGNWCAYLPPKDKTVEAKDRFFWAMESHAVRVGHLNQYVPSKPRG